MRCTIVTICVVCVLSSACSGGGGSTAPANTGTGTGNGTGSGTSTVPANTVIARAGSSFDPSTLTVAVGTSVNFTFETTAHNVTFDAVNGRPADIGTTSSATVARVFSTAGAFTYRCTIHPGMTGTVTAQ
jgi:plastocyanin